MSSDIAEDLSGQTKELISRFEERANSFSGRKDLTSLTVPLDLEDGVSAANSFFGHGEHKATGIDGSMDFDERLQMLLFYSNATGYSCPFSVGDSLRMSLDEASRESRLAASAAIPLWAEDLGNVFSAEPEIDIELEHSMERVPNSFMTLGELYLANLVCGDSRIIFLDRPLSGTYSTLSRDARNLIKRGESKLLKWSNGKVTMLDLYLGSILGSPAMSIPERARFLPSQVVRALSAGPRSMGALREDLSSTEKEIDRALKRLATVSKRLGEEPPVDASNGNLRLRAGVEGYWERVTELATSYARAAFSRRSHPLALGNDEYLNILDVNTVSLVLLQLLLQKARDTRTLLIGIAKDTTATDVTRAVLPFAIKSEVVRLAASPPRLKNDRAFLALLSSTNPSLTTPWRTVGYDSAFSTVIDVNGEFRSARQYVSREKLFIRSYFQLRTLRSDASVRSQVFLFDRAFDASADSGGLVDLEVEERGGRTRLEAYYERVKGSGLSNLSLLVLSLSDNPEVFEAFGHNQLLYLADKAVKAEVRMMRSSLRGVADLRVGGVSSRRKIFGLVTSYREQRAEAEHSRGRSEAGYR